MAVPREKFLSPIWRDGLYTNKVLFCTGGAGTICSMQVRAFVALGGNACIIGRNVEKTEAGAANIALVRPGSKVIGIAPVDVRDASTLQAAAERCVRELGGIDFCIAGAAGNFLAPMSQLSANAFKSVIDIDTLGSFNTAKAVLPHLVASAARHKNTGAAQPTGTGGRIIFVSASFHFMGKPLQSHVMAAKAAVDQISNAVAIEYGPYGVTSNVVTPGPIAGTEGMQRLAQSKDAEGRKQMTKRIPVGRWGEVKEIADATVFLFSEGGSYINGHVLVVDGGQWRVAGPADSDSWAYPDFLLSGKVVEGVKSGKKAKL